MLPWKAGEAVRAAATMFEAWIVRRGGTGSAEERNILAQVRGFLEAHGDSRFSAVEADDPRPVNNRAGFWHSVPVRGEDGEYAREYLVLSEVFRTEVCRGFEPSAVVAVLKAANALTLANNGDSTIKRRLPGLPPSRVYVIRPEIFGG